MNEYLNKPFPFIEKNNHRILASFLFSVFIYLFLIIFQPFGISNIQYYKPIFVLGYSIITFFVLLFSYFILPVIFKTYFNFDNWTIKKNAIFIALQFLIIPIFNWLYTSTIGYEITEQHSLIYFILITASVGIFPTFLLMYFVEKYLTLKNQNFADDFLQNIQQRKNNYEDSVIKLLSKNNDETILIKLVQLLCLKSEGNYVNVFFWEEDEIKSKLIRNSITNIEEQLVVFENIIRCHRSYIANLDKVIKMTGNARNFNLHIEKLEFTIPVSRSFPKEIFKKFNL